MFFTLNLLLLAEEEEVAAAAADKLPLQLLVSSCSCCCWCMPVGLGGSTGNGDSGEDESAVLDESPCAAVAVGGGKEMCGSEGLLRLPEAAVAAGNSSSCLPEGVGEGVLAAVAAAAVGDESKGTNGFVDGFPGRRVLLLAQLLTTDGVDCSGPRPTNGVECWGPPRPPQPPEFTAALAVVTAILGEP